MIDFFFFFFSALSVSLVSSERSMMLWAIRNRYLSVLCMQIITDFEIEKWFDWLIDRKIDFWLAYKNLFWWIPYKESEQWFDDLLL